MVERMSESIKFDPNAVKGVLNEYGLQCELIESEEPEIDPTSIELPHGLAIFFGDSMTLHQDVGGRIVQRGEYENLSGLIDAIREYIDLTS